MFNLLLWASLTPPTSVSIVPSPAPLDQVIIAESWPTLDETDIRLRMLHLPDWTTDGTSLYHTRTFDGFVEAIAFIDSLVEPAEQLGHHPDITVKYNQVSFALTTHDAEGLTDLDFQLARTISQL